MKILSEININIPNLHVYEVFGENSKFYIKASLTIKDGKVSTEIQALPKDETAWKLIGGNELFYKNAINYIELEYSKCIRLSQGLDSVNANRFEKHYTETINKYFIELNIIDYILLDNKLK